MLAYLIIYIEMRIRLQWAIKGQLQSRLSFDADFEPIDCFAARCRPAFESVSVLNISDPNRMPDLI